MVPPDQPGEPMIFGRAHRRRIRRAGAGCAADPKGGVVVGLVQVNAAGYYQPWEPDEAWNPRHFGFGVTDESGTVVVRTIRPAYYGEEYGAPDEPAHVHYSVQSNGALLRASEFFFADDPRLVGDKRRDAEATRAPIACGLAALPISRRMQRS